jgi:hypothetical protein
MQWRNIFIISFVGLNRLNASWPFSGVPKSPKAFFLKLANLYVKGIGQKNQPVFLTADEVFLFGAEDV